MSLNLYAKAEHLFGIEEATEELHKLYRSVLEDYEVKNLLDIGCGRGGFMKLMSAQGIACKGIDLSSVMVEDAKKTGLDVSCSDICDTEGEFDAAVAIFDVLNFLDDEALTRFLACTAERLKEGGVFVADINTLHGFSEVAEGTMTNETETEFLSVDAVFEENELHTKFTLFQKEDDGRYAKEQSTIVQYFHPLKRFRKLPGLQLVQNQTFSLYAERDKTLLVFKKTV